MGVKVDFSEIYALAKRLKKEASPAQVKRTMAKIVNETNSKHIARVLKTTPVGELNGGTLRQRWAHGIQAARFEGKRCVARLANNTEYAAYVEYGHRTRGGKGWVKGQFFMSKSLAKAPKDLKEISERELTTLLGGAINGK